MSNPGRGCIDQAKTLNPISLGGPTPHIIGLEGLVPAHNLVGYRRTIAQMPLQQIYGGIVNGRLEAITCLLHLSVLNKGSPQLLLRKFYRELGESIIYVTVEPLLLYHRLRRTLYRNLQLLHRALPSFRGTALY